jgi:hypothetical protein
MLVSSQRGLEGPTISWDGGDPQETTLPVVINAVQTESVAQAVVEQLNLPELSVREVLQNMRAEPEPGTMFVDLSYKDSEPKRAKLIANTINEVSSRKISDVTLGGDPLVATVWAPATLPKTPVSPNPVRNMLLALATWRLMLGLLITVRLGNPMRGPQKNVFPAYTASLERSNTEGAKEQELLEALGRSPSGELTAAGAALETSLTVEEADRMLFKLAAKGLLRVRTREGSGGVFYSFWPR